MSENKYQLLAIGVALSSSFGAADSNSASKIKRAGRALFLIQIVHVVGESFESFPYSQFLLQ